MPQSVTFLHSKSYFFWIIIIVIIINISQSIYTSPGSFICLNKWCMVNSCTNLTVLKESMKHFCFFKRFLVSFFLLSTFQTELNNFCPNFWRSVSMMTSVWTSVWCCELRQRFPIKENVQRTGRKKFIFSISGKLRLFCCLENRRFWLFHSTSLNMCY